MNREEKLLTHDEAAQAKGNIPEKERRRRAEAIAHAKASVGLEGFVLSPADLEHAERFIRGEMTLAEFVGRKVDV
ncbi:MAG TPA: antitoxin VbhA family protein [Acidobacteriaceae bacterium]|nr:antitoxin VbhA family protein [Acidobacteriaceae bacterium]